MRSTRQDPAAAGAVDAPERAVDRRSALKLAGIGLGSVAAVGVGVGGIRAASNGAFSAGSGDPYDLWRDWAAMSGVDRLLARMHLAATALGLGFPHMNQITERIDRDRAAGNRDAFSARWAAVLGRPASTGLVSFRIGHPERTPGL